MARGCGKNNAQEAQGKVAGIFFSVFLVLSKKERLLKSDFLLFWYEKHLRYDAYKHSDAFEGLHPGRLRCERALPLYPLSVESAGRLQAGRVGEGTSIFANK